MHDLPFQSLLQQSHSRPVSGEELETFGKKAADLYSKGEGDLTQAVVETIKHAGLSPEPRLLLLRTASFWHANDSFSAI